MSTIDYKNNIKCAVFDLDGTLLNTIKTIEYYLNLALLKNGLGSIDETACMSFVGDGAAMLIHRALGSLGADNRENFERVFRDYNEAYDQNPYYLTEPYSGITEVISYLGSRGIKMAVLSNKPDFATKAAVRYFFGDSFDLVLGGRENTPLKPSPDALFYIMSELSVTLDEVLYVGDSEVDVMTAKNAGIGNALFVTYGFRSRDQLVEAGAVLLSDDTLGIIEYIKTVRP